MQFGGYFWCGYDTQINFKDPDLVHLMSFEMNWQQTYSELSLLRWTDESYARIREFPLSTF